MSQALPEQTAPEGESPDSPLDVEDDATQPMARYTIHVPTRDVEKKEVPHVLSGLRQSLNEAGFNGRTLLPHAQGDWAKEDSQDTEDIILVMVDAPDTPDTLEALKTAAEGVKGSAQVDHVYLTVQPLRTYVV